MENGAQHVLPGLPVCPVFFVQYTETAKTLKNKKAFPKKSRFFAVLHQACTKQKCWSA